MKQVHILSWFALPLCVASTPASYKAQILRTLPHEGAPFTQGLEFVDDAKLIETSGAFPQGTKSLVRMLDAQTGSVMQSTTSGLEGRFAEDVARMADGWLVSTYHGHKALRFKADLTLDAELEWPLEEGWGLTHDAENDRYFATNGTQFMMELDAQSLALKRAAPVTCMGHKVRGLNELEFVQDFDGKGPTLFGNLYLTRFVLGIDPKTFECTSFFDLDGFGEEDNRERLGYHVANGLAFRPSSKTFFVTGKNWQKMFEISLEPAGAGNLQSLNTALSKHSAVLLALGKPSQIPAPPAQRHHIRREGASRLTTEAS